MARALVTLAAALCLIGSPVRRVVVLAAATLIFHPNATFSNEYKELTETAYCIGVLSRNIDLIKKEFGNVPGTQADQQNLARKIAFLEGAMKQRKIDIETANKLASIGHEDAQLCWDTSKKCGHEAVKRSEQKVDLDLSERMQRNCERPAVAACKRTDPCD